MDQRMESYIKNMFALIKSSYPTLNLYAYDVVNEAASESGSWRTGGSDVSGGQSMWVQIYGNNSFVEKAFTYARKYAPATTKLFYNDYNEYITAKMNYIANSIVKPLYDKGLLDGMGMQSHLDVRGNNNAAAWPSASEYGAAVKKYKDIGVEIHVTELDATIDNGDKTKFPAQAQYYKDIMNAIISNGGSSVKAVVVWGIRDDQSWRASRTPLLFEGTGNTLTKKPAYDALVSIVPAPNSSSSRAVSSSSALSSSSRAVSSSSRAASSSSNNTTPVLENRIPLSHFYVQPQSNKILRIEASSPAFVEIFDLKGNRAASFDVSGTSQTIKLSLPNGVYFAKVRGMKSVRFALK
jgi:hypothetical protein